MPNLIVPVKLCEVAGSIHLFKLVGKITPGSAILKRNWIWDILEIDWKEVSMTLNGNNINLPTSVVIPFIDKFKIKQLVNKELLLFHIMLKQGRTWFTLENRNKEEEPLSEIA